MKTSKPIHRLHKTPRASSPVRKTRIGKKIGLSRSPTRNSGSSRPTGHRPPSPSIKRGPLPPPPPPQKRSHSPRHRTVASPHRSVSRRSHGSPVTIDRTHSTKRHGYEKRKTGSPSPVPRRIPPPPRSLTPQARVVSPFPPDRYPTTRPSGRLPRFDSPPKKKPHREPERFRGSPSSPHLPIERGPPRTVSEGHSSHRDEGNMHSTAVSSMIPHDHHAGRNIGPMSGERPDDSYIVQSRARLGYGTPSSVISNREKEMASIKPSYDRESVEHYRRSNSPNDRYTSESEKHYATTLDERFRSVSETNRAAEPRLRYTREDLEKITIDIRRNLRDHSPTLRRIVNPSEVKLVRRSGEGHRPIFDREEIKQAPRDLREDAYFEHKMMSNSRESGMTSYGVNLREVENYEITRHRFDAYHPPINSGSGRSLSDRWQNLESRKDATCLDRDERDREYERSHTARDFVEERHQRSRSADRDFRSERYHSSSSEISRAKPGYSDSHRRLPNDPSDLRHSLTVRRKDGSLLDARQRIMERRGSDRELIPDVRSESRSHLHSRSERRYLESSESSRERHASSRRPSELEAPKWDHVRARSGSRDEKLPDFSRRPDRYNYKPWLDKPDVTPKGPSYFEHDNREGSESYRGRSSSRPFRSIRGFRSRGFRGLPRGSLRSRGSYRGFRSSMSPRGRGLSSRRGRFSPGLWEHDMYARMSQDRKSGNHAT